MSHTLGPWVATNGMTNEYGIYGADEWPIFTIRDGLIPAREDARLIAAAPDLLLALQRAANLLARYPEHTDAWRECRAAIDRVTGGAA